MVKETSSACFLRFLSPRFYKLFFLVGATLLSLLFYLPLHFNNPKLENIVTYGNIDQLDRTYVTKLPEFEQRIITNKNKNYTILFWAHGERMIRRFVRSYGTRNLDPFAECPVKNCNYKIDDRNSLNESDLVLIHLHQTESPQSLPPYRLPHQRWVFFTDESPRNTFYANPKNSMKDYNGLFNWSMTYRSDSDVPAAYGRTVKLKKKISLDKVKDYFTKNVRGIAVMGSNCGGTNYRWPFIREMQRYIEVDTYGQCGDFKCPGSFMKDCQKLNDYKFYLAFENCNCREYITEKLWWNAYGKESIPVVMGATIKDYEKLCPPNSFIHVESFNGPKELAKYLQYLLNNKTAYNRYFQWKTEYKVLNEHGYFRTPSKHICHICETLNNPRQKEFKIYNNLEKFWNPTDDCRGPKWRPENSFSMFY